MAKANSFTPPFAWLGRFWVPVGVVVLAGLAAFFRFYQLGTLPPGLDEASARIGIQSLKLSSALWLPHLDQANGYSPLWVWLQAISIQIFGHTTLALRLWPALLGTLAVVITWFWLRDWFDQRIAWIGAFFLAVSPWAVTIARTGQPSALLVLLVPLTLWLASRAVRQPNAARYAALGAVLAADLLAGPIGWLLALTVLAVGTWRLAAMHNLMEFNRSRLIGAGLLGAGAALLAYLIAVSLPALRDMPAALNIATTPAELFNNIVKVLLMFNVHGDENYRHNLSGEPMLNAFVGLMMVAGLLVSISRLQQLRYRIILILSLIMLLPAFLTTAGVPNSSWAVGVMPLLFALASIGTSYMLELWYATFPINSAARAAGQSAIIVLLVLTMLHGHTQYFRAWAGSSAVYVTHNEGAQQIAEHLKTDKPKGGLAATQRFVVIPTDQQPVIEYLDYGMTGVTLITTAELTALPIAPGNRQFYIGSTEREAASKALKAKFPGGTLTPHYSPFNRTEIYYTYEVAK